MRAKKSLGQHFLKSERALSKIVEAADLGKEDLVLEIGPGTGALTKKLLETGAKVVAVEKDNELFELLKQEFAKEIESKRLELIHEDIMDSDLAKLASNNYKLVANIPYNITGAILKKFLGAKNRPRSMVLLVQKEVAQRIIARDGKESILSISVKAYGVPRLVEIVKAGSFAPVPKVDSAIIAIENISKEFFKDLSEEKFFAMLHVGFKSKRKKLSSNLSTIFKKKVVLEIFKRLGLNENIRAEDIFLKDWQRLSQTLLNGGAGSYLGH